MVELLELARRVLRGVEYLVGYTRSYGYVLDRVDIAANVGSSPGAVFWSGSVPKRGWYNVDCSAGIYATGSSANFQADWVAFATKVRPPTNGGAVPDSSLLTIDYIENTYGAGQNTIQLHCTCYIEDTWRVGLQFTRDTTLAATFGGALVLTPCAEPAETPAVRGQVVGQP